jgi:N-acetylglucosaminyl-diphospho-decaprenol L-rhamnosyltransferase
MIFAASADGSGEQRVAETKLVDKNNCRLSIIIVSFNTRALTLACLRSVFAQAQSPDFEVLVFDNASSDGSAAVVEAEFGHRVRLVKHPDNIGFAAANNRAAGEARGEYLLLLNPDTLILNHAIDRLLAFAESHPQHGIYGGRTVYADGSLNFASCLAAMTPWSLFCGAVGLTTAFPRSDWFDREAMGRWERDSVREVDIVVGCFFLLKKSTWEQLGGFDLKYWMYGEEADLCLRAQRLGYRPIITPEATIVHYMGAASTASERTPMIAKAKSTLVRDHWSPSAQPWGLSMLWLWAAVRYAASFTLATLSPARFDEKHQVSATVWRTRRDWLSGYRQPLAPPVSQVVTVQPPGEPHIG